MSPGGERPKAVVGIGAVWLAVAAFLLMVIFLGDLPTNVERYMLAAVALLVLLAVGLWQLKPWAYDISRLLHAAALVVCCVAGVLGLLRGDNDLLTEGASGAVWALVVVAQLERRDVKAAFKPQSEIYSSQREP